MFSLGLVSVSAAQAQDCPKAPNHIAAVDALLAQVREAKNDRSARVYGAQLWALWADAPDEPAQELLDAGMEKLRYGDFLGAIQTLDRLIAYCPEYAEGYNQRAYVNFLRKDFAAALPDLDRAIALSPNHVAAISGKGLTLIGLGRKVEARQMLEQAVALNPWLSERHLLEMMKAEEQEL